MHFIVEYQKVEKVLYRRIPAINVLTVIELGNHLLVTLEIMGSRQWLSVAAKTVGEADCEVDRQGDRKHSLNLSPHLGFSQSFMS